MSGDILEYDTLSQFHFMRGINSLHKSGKVILLPPYTLNLSSVNMQQHHFVALLILKSKRVSHATLRRLAASRKPVLTSTLL